MIRGTFQVYNSVVFNSSKEVAAYMLLFCSKNDSFSVLVVVFDLVLAI